MRFGNIEKGNFYEKWEKGGGYLWVFEVLGGKRVEGIGWGRGGVWGEGRRGRVLGLNGGGFVFK